MTLRKIIIPSSRTCCKTAVVSASSNQLVNTNIQQSKNYQSTEVQRGIKMLYLVGLGLADEKDISVRGLEVVKSAERVYLEAYTSILLVDKEKLVRDL